MTPSPVLDQQVGIYGIVGASRIYIGSSTNLRKRYVNHVSQLRRNVHHNSHLQNAWNKYGEDAFEFVVLEECAIEQLIEREQHWLDTTLDKYNHHLSANSVAGHTPSDEVRKKISETLKGHEVSEETRLKIGMAGTGRVVTPETRMKISETMRGVPKSEETKQRMRVAAQARVARQRTEKETS